MELEQKLIDIKKQCKRKCRSMYNGNVACIFELEKVDEYNDKYMNVQLLIKYRDTGYKITTSRNVSFYHRAIDMMETKDVIKACMEQIEATIKDALYEERMLR